MKKILSIALLAVLVGCTLSQQRIAFNTISSVETSTRATYDAYFLSVARGQVRTNGLPEVSHAYTAFKGGVLVALDLVQNNTNALAPDSLNQLSADVLNAIAAARGIK